MSTFTGVFLAAELQLSHVEEERRQNFLALTKIMAHDCSTSLDLLESSRPTAQPTPLTIPGVVLSSAIRNPLILDNIRSAELIAMFYKIATAQNLAAKYNISARKYDIFVPSRPFVPPGAFEEADQPLTRDEVKKNDQNKSG